MTITVSVDGKLISLEDSRAFLIQDYISSDALLVSLASSPNANYYFEISTSSLHYAVPLISSEMNEENGSTDGKPFIRQTVAFRPSTEAYSEASLFGSVDYPINMPDDFEVLRVDEVGIDGSSRQRLIDLDNVWTSSTNGKRIREC
ncbi:unnamed protein product [Anisakis simplex]|uniref:Cadherin domain-containing protein n=1 Tax=Anisakis simplex TaxID=6269 RepID=A0A0M3JHI2_ANISI|nr:unnamed protein product [Anisakis simplex]